MRAGAIQADEFLTELAGEPSPTLDELGPVAARQLFDEVIPEWDLPPETVPFEEVAFDGGGACEPMRARLYRPSAAAGPEVVVHLHGGGWVVGGWSTHHSLCATVARALGRTLLLPLYARAPEAPRRNTLEDVRRAADHGERLAALGGARGRGLILMGDSAGGNLALVETLLRPSRVAQTALLYPALDMTASGGSFDEFAQGHLLSAADMRWYERTYAVSDDLRLPELSPGLAALPDGLPPISIVAAGRDVLRDQARRFAARLALEGREVHYSEMHGLIHGCFMLRRRIPAAAAALTSWLLDFRLRLNAGSDQPGVEPAA